MQKTYKVAAWRLPELLKKFEALQRKAEKLGQALTFEETGTETEEETARNEETGQDEPTGLIKHYSLVQLTGSEPVLAGYLFCGVLQHQETGNIYRPVPGVTIPEDYRHRPQQCDHCNQARQRRDTYVVNKIDTDGIRTDEYKQVGSNCLRDFLGGHDPHAMLSMLESWSEFEAELETAPEYDAWRNYSERGTMRPAETVNILTILEHAANASTSFGYVSRANAEKWGKQATAEVVISNLDPTRRQKLKDKEKTHPTEANREEAQNALTWIRSIEENSADLNRSEYLRNVYYACQADGTEYRNFGLVVSLIPTYRKAQDLIIARKAAKNNAEFCSEYVGTVGERLTLLLTVTSIYDYQNDYDNSVTYIHRLTDAAGHKFTWFTSSTRLEEGKTQAITGTVKDHKINSKTQEAETVLTRCKVETNEKKLKQLGMFSPATRTAPEPAPHDEVIKVSEEIRAAIDAGQVGQLSTEPIYRLIDTTRRVVTQDEITRARQELQTAINKQVTRLETIKNEALNSLDQAETAESNDIKASYTRGAISQAIAAGMMPARIGEELRQRLYSTEAINNGFTLQDVQEITRRYLTIQEADRVTPEAKSELMSAIIDAAKTQEGETAQHKFIAEFAADFSSKFNAMTHDEHAALYARLEKITAPTQDEPQPEPQQESLF